MKLTDLIRDTDARDVVDIAVRGLDIIGMLTRNSAVDAAADVLVLVRNVYDAIVDAAAQRITPEAARAELLKLERGLAANDAVADAALEAKFPEES